MSTTKTSRTSTLSRAASTDATRPTASSGQSNGHNTKPSVSLESVIITDELGKRLSRRPQFAAENRVLLALAQDIADCPERIFEKLAQAALELCRAHSAGFTVLEEDANIFRWRAVAGQWAAHTGEVASADFAICSTLFERPAAQLFRRPERHFTYLAAITPPIEESLLVPFYSKGKLAGALWVLAHDRSRQFDAEDLRLITDLAAFASAGYQILRAAQADEKADALRLRKVSTELIQAGDTGALYTEILDAAIAIMRSKMGSLQMLYPERGELRLLAYKGFHPSSAKFWEWVRPASASTCGMALQTRGRIIVPDVENCAFMAGAEDLHFYRKSEIRAVQSTPLISRSGVLLGMISTHWRQPHDPSERDLRLLDILARQAADFIERTQAEEALKRANDKLEERVQKRTRELQQQVSKTQRAEDELRAVTARLFKIQDEERRYVARELHAGASQTLAALSMNVGRITQNVARPNTLFEVVQECNSLIANLTREIRTISYLLHPPLLEDLGLGFALRIYAQGFSERSGIRVEVEEDQFLEHLPKDSEIAVFRVIQESLTNIHRHSGASAAKIRVSHSDAGLQVKITDNGKGISAEKQRELADSAESGVGILGMRERIRQLGGTFEITSGTPVADDRVTPDNAAAFTEAFSLSSGAASTSEERGKRRAANPGTCVSVTLPLSNAATA
jgi:signal transduction histidine kinase